MVFRPRASNVEPGTSPRCSRKAAGVALGGDFMACEVEDMVGFPFVSHHDFGDGRRQAFRFNPSNLSVAAQKELQPWP